MKDKVLISEEYEKDGKKLHNVTIKGEKFEDIPNIPKYEKCSIANCKYYNYCKGGKGVVRKFDCQKNAVLANQIWNSVTGALVAYMTITFYRTFALGFLKGTAAMTVFIVVLDAICCGIEMLVPILRDKYFYRNLKRNVEKVKAEEEKKRVAEEIKRIKEEEEADAKDPNRKKVREAESILNQIEQISEEINFGDSNEDVKFCVDKCKEIIEHLKNDSSGYNRVESLLKELLPKFYQTLSYYAEFEKAGAVEEKHEKKLNEVVNDFYHLLHKQKVEVIFDKRATELKFNASVDTLKTEIENRGGSL